VIDLAVLFKKIQEDVNSKGCWRGKIASVILNGNLYSAYRVDRVFLTDTVERVAFAAARVELGE